MIFGLRMKTLRAGFFAGIALFALIGTAQGVERVMVGEVEATRIVVAPPQTVLARTIRDGLRNTMATAQTSRAASEADQLYYFYGNRHFEPLWLTENPDGTVDFSSAAQDVVALFESAYLEGLDPADYLTPDLKIDAAMADPRRLAALESAFSGAMLRYAQDAQSGRLDPASVSGYIDIDRKPINEKALLDRLSASSDPASILAGFHPDHAEFRALRDLLASHYDGSVTEVEPIGAGKLLRLGATDARVPLLRDRLDVSLAADADPLVYDAQTVAAVEAFQAQIGLNPDGVVGPATIAAINGANGANRATIIANMERWRWMPEDLGDFHVFVNIPEFSVEVSKNDQVMWNSRVIVGTYTRQTPLFSDKIRHVVTNPYWNVPPTILRQDVMPNVAANPGYLASQNMELLYGGRAIDPWTVDWTQANPNQFRVRQRPGRSNSLGQVKFLFPNTHDVYLHDTNSPGLFQRSMRALSSGCVRVQDPFGFAEALLEFEPSLTVAALEGSLGTNERWFNMDRQVPVHLAYFTLRINEDGSVRTFGDLYDHDEKIIEMLGL